jgi:phosphatidylglycerophosphatase A
MNWISLAISSTLFTGFLPGKITRKDGAGGGLMGSFVGLIFQIGFIYFNLSILAEIYLITFSFILGLIFVEKAEKFMFSKWGEKKRHTGEFVSHDYNQTNIDEVHGQAIAGLPVFLFSVIITSFSSQVLMLLVSFIAFRIFDVMKPWPVEFIEKNGGSSSAAIMLDDTVAGIMAAIIVSVIIISFYVQ